MRRTAYVASGPGITAQAPCRADMAGGTMDLCPLYLFHPAALTLNFAVNILTTCRITPLKGKRIYLRSLDTRREEEFSSFEALRTSNRFRLPLGARLLQFFAPKEGLLMETDSESPAGAGISGSSALMIASTAALARFTGRNLTLEQMRVIAQNVEAQIIEVPTGCQDYYPALYGGVSAIRLDADGIHREAVPLLREEWKLRRSNAPGITTPLIDKLVAVASKNGGRAAKVCGAGGGGCVIFLVDKGSASRVATAVGDAGGRVLPLQVA